jgi:hypothetical protein
MRQAVVEMRVALGIQRVSVCLLDTLAAML